MSNRLGFCLALILMLAVNASTLGTVSADFPGGGGTASVGNPSPGHWTVTLTRTDSSSTTRNALVVSNNNTDIIDSIVVVTNDHPGITQVIVRSSNPSDSRIASLGSLTKTGTGPVTLEQMNISGDLGSTSTVAIEVDTIITLRVGRDVLGDISVVNDSFGQNSLFGRHLLGNLTVSNGSIINLDVIGDIGTSFNSRACIIVGGNIVRLQAANLYADIDVTGAVQTLRALGAPGNYVGNFHAGALAVVGSGTGEFTILNYAGFDSYLFSFEIDGDVGVTTSIPQCVNALIHGDVTGYTDFIGSLTIEGSVAEGALIALGNNLLAGSSLVIQGDLDGRIELGRTPAETTGSLVQGVVRVMGDVNGVIAVYSNPASPSANGSISGSIQLNSDLQGSVLVENTLTSTGTIYVGGPTLLPATSLKGQIIINRGNLAAGAWDGGIYVGEDALPGTPYYSIPSSSLGGGAVGLAPFHFYPEDCSPPQAGYRLLSGFHDMNPVYLTFYGPVAAANESLPVAVIDYHRAYHPYCDEEDNWAPADAMFTIEVDDVNPRRLRITPAAGNPKMPGEYRVRTTTNLVCADVTGSPLPQAAEYMFWLALNCNGVSGADAGDFLTITYPPGNCTTATPNLSVDCNRNGIDDCCDIALGGIPGNPNTCVFSGKGCYPDCACDFNHDEVLNSQDFFDFLDCFFTVACPDADYNNDSLVNSQDFFDFLTCFFSGC